MIQLKNVSKIYQIDEETAFAALENVSLEIKRGELSAIIGPSGSGKSTLMHVIGLLDRPTAGDIVIRDKNISSLSDDELSALRNEFVGFVFQQFNLINKFTVLENILLPTVYTRKRLAYNPKVKAMEIIKKFGLLGKENSFPNKISGGQQQRVAIARALIMEPEVILADEPTGNLDTKTGREILNLLLTLNKTEKITLIIVTHDREIAKMTRRTITIVDGKIV